MTSSESPYITIYYRYTPNPRKPNSSLARFAGKPNTGASKPPQMLKPTNPNPKSLEGAGSVLRFRVVGSGFALPKP